MEVIQLFYNFKENKIILFLALSVVSNNFTSGLTSLFETLMGTTSYKIMNEINEIKFSSATLSFNKSTVRVNKF